MRVKYDPNAVKAIEIWEPVCYTVGDDNAHVHWGNSDGKRWRKEGIIFGNLPTDSKVFRSGEYFDNFDEAYTYMYSVMMPEYYAKVEAGAPSIAGRTVPGFAEIQTLPGLSPDYKDGDHFWDAYFEFVINGKVNKRNSYAWKTEQWTWDKVSVYAFRVEKKTVWIPA
jgi:hypothetical protein